MSIFAWIVVGLIAGFIASKILDHRGQGVILDIILGVLGAVVGGFLFNMLGVHGVNGINVWSLAVATIGALVVLGLKHALMGRRTG